MSKIRINKNQGFTYMSNYHLKDTNLSLKGKGLLSVMFSLPENWNYSIEGLVAILKESETAVVSTLKELKKYGYLNVIKLLPNETKTGRIEYIYDVFEIPKQESEKQDLEILGVENLGLENVGQLNTNNQTSNNKEDNKEIVKKENNIKERFTIPTLEQVIEYCINERQNDVDPETFYNFYESKGWMVGKNKMKNWKAAVRTWENKNKKEKGNNIKAKPSWYNEYEKELKEKGVEQETNDNQGNIEELKEFFVK